MHPFLNNHPPMAGYKTWPSGSGFRPRRDGPGGASLPGRA